MPAGDEDEDGLLGAVVGPRGACQRSPALYPCPFLAIQAVTRLFHYVEWVTRTHAAVDADYCSKEIRLRSELMHVCVLK